MKTVNSDLLNLLLSSNVGWMADAYRFVLPNGTELRYTEFDYDIVMPYRDAALSLKPILYYPFLSATNIAADEVPLGHNGGTSGSPTHVTSSTSPNTFITLDGNSYITGPSDDPATAYDERDFLNLQHGFTVVLWIRPNTGLSNSEEGIVNYGNRMKLSIKDDSSGSLLFSFSALGINYPQIPFASGVNSSSWHMVAVGWDGNSEWRFFHNGAFQSIDLFQRNWIEYQRRFKTWDRDDTFDYSLTIGSDGSSNFVGDIAHFAIFPRALNKEDLDFLYEAKDGIRFKPGPILARSRLNEQIGIKVDELRVTLTPRLAFKDDGTVDQAASDMVGNSGTPLLFALNNHGLEGSKVFLYRCFSPSPPRYPQNLGSSLESASDEVLDISDPSAPFVTPTGVVLRFVGFISSINVRETESEIEVKSALAYLDQQVPRYIVRSGCAWNLFSKGCGLNKENFRVETSVVSRLKGSVWKFTVDPVPAVADKAQDYFALGYVEFLSGKNSFVRRSIKTSSGSFIELSQPLPYPPEPGDRVALFPGCDKTVNTCQNKFNNLKKFRGFPFTPAPDTLIGMEPDEFETEEI